MKKKVQHLLSVIVITGFVFAAIGSGEDKKEVSNIESNEVKKDEIIKKENWTYSESEDKMEGTKQFFASTTSINEIEFEFPYNGGSSLSVIVRNLGSENEVLLSISKGQFMTSISNRESFKVKFDDEKPVVYYFNSASDGSSDLIFVNNSNKFIDKIMKSKNIMIEVPFYNAGNQVFEFNVENLKWDK